MVSPRPDEWPEGLAVRVDEVHDVVSRRLDEEREKSGPEVEAAGRLVAEIEGVGKK